MNQENWVVLGNLDMWFIKKFDLKNSKAYVKFYY